MRPALLALLALTSVLYLWDLGASGWANAFYSAAVEAATKNGLAFFFGSFDPQNFITVDKPPVFLWVMDLSARLFGLSPWSVLAPQALEGVASVLLVYAAVARWFRPGSALLAGLVMALTPVAALMFRFNNPDALLVMLLAAAAYAMVRAIEAASTRWLILAAVLIGLAFLTKFLAAYLVVPAFVLVYLASADAPFRRKLGQILMAGAALVVASGWWIAIVELIPASHRPYIGSSQNNSLLNLIFAYNGFGRLTGVEPGAVSSAGPVRIIHSSLRPEDLLRLFFGQMGAGVAWLIPAAVLLSAAVLILSKRSPRLSRWRVQTLLWGGWFLVTWAVFSLSLGIIHSYYTVALAPAVAAMVGVGADFAWERRHRPEMRLLLALVIAATALWSFIMLGRSPSFVPALRQLILPAGLIAALLVAVGASTWRRLLPLGLVLGVIASLAGPAAYTLATTSRPHQGAIPPIGPAAVRRLPTHPLTAAQRVALEAGGLLRASRPTLAVRRVLLKDARRYVWVAAVVRANPAAGYELATGEPVMAIGGFNGTDPAPTLSAFEEDVREGRIHYFIASPPVRFGGVGDGTAGSITHWVERHFAPITVDGIILYDLARPGRAGT